MGCWRYCNKCGHAQDRITFEEVSYALLSSSMWNKAYVTCDHCDERRDDDQEEERQLIIIGRIEELERRLESVLRNKDIECTD